MDLGEKAFQVLMDEEKTGKLGITQRYQHKPGDRYSQEEPDAAG
jgi:hypothetical protein